MCTSMSLLRTPSLTAPSYATSAHPASYVISSFVHKSQVLSTMYMATPSSSTISIILTPCVPPALLIPWSHTSLTRIRPPGASQTYRSTQTPSPPSSSPVQARSFSRPVARRQKFIFPFITLPLGLGGGMIRPLDYVLTVQSGSTIRSFMVR